jgi:acyl transferase domain-containing protein
VPETHWSWKDFFDADPKKPDHVYCKRGGFASPLSFDPTEFGIPPSSLEATDTSQLLGLVVAKKALEDAFNKKDNAFNRSRTSVILGVTGTQELVIPLGARLGHPIWRSALEDSGIDPHKTEEVIQKISDSYVSWQESSFPGLLGNVVAGRISNRLDLGGTNCVVDAACASSMSAIHLAVMELISGRSDTVITGGVDMLNDIFMHMCFSKTMVLSPTGDVRPFSQDADGTVLGEGIGLFVLKRLEDAQKDGNRIYAVIKGVGSSSDGKSQSIYAPRAQGQAKALKMAYDEAGIDPSTVELIEAHGTGTKVGDEVEFQALKGLFGQPDNNHRKCALGSVKSMIGHTKAAAGLLPEHPVPTLVFQKRTSAPGRHQCIRFRRQQFSRGDRRIQETKRKNLLGRI